MQQLQQQREPLPVQQKCKLLLLLLLHLTRERKHLIPALLGSQLSVHRKEQIVSLALVEALLLTGQQLQQDCSQLSEAAAAAGNAAVAATAAEGAKTGSRLLQLLQRLGTRGPPAAAAASPSAVDTAVADARHALLQTVSYVWRQQQQQTVQQQQRDQQQQQQQTARALLQVVGRLDDLPKHLLLQLPKQLAAVGPSVSSASRRCL